MFSFTFCFLCFIPSKLAKPSRSPGVTVPRVLWELLITFEADDIKN